MPKSFVEICRVFGHIIGHIVGLQMSEDEIVKVFKEQLKTTVRKYDYDPDRAKI